MEAELVMPPGRIKQIPKLHNDKETIRSKLGKLAKKNGFVNHAVTIGNTEVSV